MSGKELTFQLTKPFWISYICECMARGLPEDSIIKLLTQDDALDGEQAKALIRASLGHLKIEGLDREQERGLALARLRFLYRSLVEKRDYKSAHAVEQTRISLLELNEVNPTLRYVDPGERRKSIDLIRENELKGEQLYESLQALANGLETFQDTLEETAAKHVKRGGSAGGPPGGGSFPDSISVEKEVKR